MSALGPDGVAPARVANVEVHCAVLEQRRAGDDLRARPAASVVRARSTVRMPPPTRQGSAAQICATRRRCRPAPMAASRSISCTFGKRGTVRIHASTSSSRGRASRPARAGRSGRPGDRSKESACQVTAHRNAPCREQVLLSSATRVLGVVEDRGRERGVGAAAREDVDEVLERAGAAGRDHRDGHRRRHGGGQLAVEAGARAVAIDRRQQDLAGAARLGLPRPLDGVARRSTCCRCARRPRSVPPCALGVDGDDDRLAAVACREPW